MKKALPAAGCCNARKDAADLKVDVAVSCSPAGHGGVCQDLGSNSRIADYGHTQHLKVNRIGEQSASEGFTLIVIVRNKWRSALGRYVG